jgi:hypothetical protein
MHGYGCELVKALREERNKQPKEDEVLEAFKQLLRREDAVDEAIVNAIFNKESGMLKTVELKALDPEYIFTESEIKTICIRYRLRFLDASFFKGDIPYEAIAKIKRIQKTGNIELKNFKIVAPAGLFRLRHKDRDPLLFLALGNGKYYLIHQWGKDLHPLRGVMMYPFRNFATLFKTIALMALISAAILPASLVMGPNDQHAFPIRVIFFFYVLIALCGLTSLYGFSRLKNFSSALWNSRYDD